MKASWLASHRNAAKWKRQHQFMLAQGLVGRTVVWANDSAETGERMHVESATFDGMVRVSGYSGDFAPHIFKVVSE